MASQVHGRKKINRKIISNASLQNLVIKIEYNSSIIEVTNQETSLSLP